MPDEIIIKPRTESTPQPGPSAVPASTRPTERPAPSQDLSPLVTLCAVGLFIGFFLPWVNFLGAHPSGFDIQKLGDEQKFLWLIPIFSGIAILAGIARQSQRLASQAAGLMPYIALAYWLNKLGSDLINNLDYGAYLCLICGLGLLILPRRLR